MKQGYTDITVLIDKSGSMAHLRKDTIGGFNTFLQQQKELSGQAALTVVQFDSDSRTTVAAQDVKLVANLSEATYYPGGGTALYDTLGSVIDATGRRFAAMREEDRPERVIFLIITDGEDTSSHILGASEVQVKIRHQRDAYRWDFQYIGANVDAVKEAVNMGILASKALNYAPDAKGSNTAYMMMARNVTSYRSAQTQAEGAVLSCFAPSDHEEALGHIPDNVVAPQDPTPAP